MAVFGSRTLLVALVAGVALHALVEHASASKAAKSTSSKQPKAGKVGAKQPKQPKQPKSGKAPSKKGKGAKASKAAQAGVEACGRCTVCGGAGQAKTKLLHLELEYTGVDCAGSACNSQSADKASVNSPDALDGQFATVTVAFNKKNGDKKQISATAADVAVGGTIAVTDFAANVVATISAGGVVVSTVHFHGSCSQPIVMDDQFGSLKVVGFSTDDGRSRDTCQPNDCSPTPTPSPKSCTICDRSNKNRPSSLTFLYTAGQGTSQNQQGDKANGAGLLATYPDATTVGVSGKHGGGVLQQATHGQEFTVEAPGGKFDAESTVSFGNGQSFEFHTSCSVPLVVGDVYGPLTVVGGGSCQVPVDPCATQLGCCTGTKTPKVDVVGSNCPCGTTTYGCCGQSNIRKTDAAGSTCPCSTTTFGCCGKPPPNPNTVVTCARGQHPWVGRLLLRPAPALAAPACAWRTQLFQAHQTSGRPTLRARRARAAQRCAPPFVCAAATAAWCRQLGLPTPSEHITHRGSLSPSLFCLRAPPPNSPHRPPFVRNANYHHVVRRLLGAAGRRKWL